MKVLQFQITQDLRAALLDSDGEGSYGRVSLTIRECGIHGDISVAVNLDKKDAKKLLEFLRRASQVLR